VTERCTRTPIARNPDGSLASWQAEQALRARDRDLKACDDKRQLAVDAWPN
jgi:hypothetical protein